mgnify:CR=1 FL=1
MKTSHLRRIVAANCKAVTDLTGIHEFMHFRKLFSSTTDTCTPSRVTLTKLSSFNDNQDD